jgi:Tfp pilus assembly protein PilN
MIEINLLPDDFKSKQKSNKQSLPINLILISINAVLVVILLIVTAINLSNTIKLNAMNTRLAGLAPEQQKIISLQRKIESLKATNQSFYYLVEDRFLWAKKLYYLDELLIPGVWLRNLSLKREVINAMVDASYPGNSTNYLEIDASVVSVSSDEMGLIGKLIRNLKTSKEFFQDFSNIELEGVVRRTIASVEIMDFTLICKFKPEKNI